MKKLSIQLPFARHVLGISIPIAISRAITTAGGFIGIFLLAHYKQDALAASALITSSQMFILLAGMAILFSISILAGQAFGAKDASAIKVIFQQGILLSLAISPILILAFWKIGAFLIFLHQPTSLSVMAGHYFKILSFGVPAMLIYTSSIQILYGINKPQVALAADFIGLLLFIVLAVIFIFGKLGAQPMGVSGLALAAVIQSVITTLLLLLYMGINTEFKSYQLYSCFSYNKQVYRQLLHIGIPISIHISSELLSLALTTVMIGWLGVTALKIQQACSQYLLLLVVPLFGMSQAASVLISQFSAKNNSLEFIELGNTAIKFGCIFTTLVIAICLIIPHSLISVFIDNHGGQTAALFEKASVVLVIIMIGQFFDGIRNIATGALRGLHETKKPMQISVFFIWVVSIPLSYIMGFVFHWGLIGICIAHDIGLLLSGICVLALWKIITTDMSIKNKECNAMNLQAEHI